MRVKSAPSDKSEKENYHWGIRRWGIGTGGI